MGLELDNQRQIKEFLDGILLSEHLDKFTQNKVNFEQIYSFTDEDLKEIGIMTLGDRKKILTEIRKYLNNDNKDKLVKKLIFTRKILQAILVIGIIISFIISLSWFRKEIKHDDFVSITEMLQLPLIWIFVFALGFIYMLPSYLAFRNLHQYRWAILLVNSFFGATIIMWFICLFVSLKLIGDKETALLTYLGSKKIS